MKLPLKGNFLSRDQTWNTTQFRRKAARGSPDHASGKLPWVLSISEIKLLEKKDANGLVLDYVEKATDTYTHTNTNTYSYICKVYMQGERNDEEEEREREIIINHNSKNLKLEHTEHPRVCDSARMTDLFHYNVSKQRLK